MYLLFLPHESDLQLDDEAVLEQHRSLQPLRAELPERSGVLRHGHLIGLYDHGQQGGW